MNWRQKLPPNYNRCGAARLAVGALALGLCLVGLFYDRGQFFRSYLIAYMFWLGIPLGCLGIVMIHHLVGGTWGFVIQRSLESATRTFPIMACCFSHCCSGYRIYLSGRTRKLSPRIRCCCKKPPISIFRLLSSARLCISQFGSPSVFSKPLVGGTGPQRRPRAHAAAANSKRAGAGPVRTHGNFFRHRLADVAGAALVLDDLRHALHGQHGLIALTFVIGVAYFLSRREPLSRIIAPWVLHDLGNLLLAFVMLWAYMSFAQFLIIWVENLQHEIPWYLHRINGGWGVIAVALIVLQFALPFILLLSRTSNAKPQRFARRRRDRADAPDRAFLVCRADVSSRWI